MIRVRSGQYWIGWPAGYGNPAVMLATSVGLTYGAIVGGRPVNITIAPAETDLFEDFSGAAAG